MTNDRAWVRFEPGYSDPGGGGASELGQKGASLVEMAAGGYPVPAGFVIPTSVCADLTAARARAARLRLDGLLADGVAWLQERSQRVFGRSPRPLLLSVRSGAAVSIPGLTEPVLNIGLTPRLIDHLSAGEGTAVFFHDCYARYLASLLAAVDEDADDLVGDLRGEVLDCRAAVRPAEALHGLCRRIEGEIRSRTGDGAPGDAPSQLRQAVELALAGWKRDAPRRYLRHRSIKNVRGVAVVVQEMVFGNLDGSSGAGAGFSRNPRTGEPDLYGEYLQRGQGTDALTGRGVSLEDFAQSDPDAHEHLVRLVAGLERDFRDLQDFEFTVERGEVFLLQTRPGKTLAQAAVRIASDLVDEGVITPQEAAGRITQEQIEQLQRPVFDPAARSRAVLLCRGLPASPDTGTGGLSFSPRDCIRRAAEGEPIVLVLDDPASGHDKAALLEALSVAQALVSAEGTMTSDPAVITRQVPLPYVAAAAPLAFDPVRSRARLGQQWLGTGDAISVDGSSGEVFLGALPQMTPPPGEYLGRVLEWRARRGS